MQHIYAYNSKQEQTFQNFCGDDYILTPSILPKVPRIVVIGDIHGDFQLIVSIIKQAKVADYVQNQLIWTGGNTHVVQVGDQIDRCRPYLRDGMVVNCDTPYATRNDEANDITVLKLFNELHKQAVQEGGAVICLLGNHETMNSEGILDYVSYAGIQEFSNYIDPYTGKKFKSGKKARRHAFAPGNQYGKLMGCSRIPAIIIGSNLFVHAGIINDFIKEHNIKGRNDLHRINTAVKLWLMGVLKSNDESYVNSIVQASDTSLFWTRVLGMLPPNLDKDDPSCAENISNVLHTFEVDRIIIGHTPQFIHSVGINSTCNKHVWRIDTASSSAFNNLGLSTYSNTFRKPQYLEIRNDNEFYICSEDGCKLA